MFAAIYDLVHGFGHNYHNLMVFCIFFGFLSTLVWCINLSNYDVIKQDLNLVLAAPQKFLCTRNVYVYTLTRIKCIHVIFCKKLVYKKLVLSCAKGQKSSVLDF